MSANMNTCVACGEIDALDVHHVTPRALGGDDCTKNIIMVCKGCHKIIHKLGIHNSKDIREIEKHGIAMHILANFLAEENFTTKDYETYSEKLLNFSQFIVRKIIRDKSSSSLIRQGLSVARAKGKTLGRPKAKLPDDFIKEYRKFKNGKYGDMTVAGFASMIGIARSTLYKYIAMAEQQKEP